MFDYTNLQVKLKHESEFVTGLSAETCNGYITSLTFHTNLRKHEVVHLTFDSKFQKPQKIELRSGILKRCEFGGFFGSFDSLRLISIGFHVRPVHTDVKIKVEITWTYKPLHFAALIFYQLSHHSRFYVFVSYAVMVLKRSRRDEIKWSQSVS